VAALHGAPHRPRPAAHAGLPRLLAGLGRLYVRGRARRVGPGPRPAAPDGGPDQPDIDEVIAGVLPDGKGWVIADPQAIVRARRLSRATMADIRQNLFFAFAYDSADIPSPLGCSRRSSDCS